MKCVLGDPQAVPVASHPSRGAWIEMSKYAALSRTQGSRTPHGVRGLKYIYKERLWQNVKVAPLTGCVD